MVAVVIVGALVLIAVAVGLSLLGDTLEPEPVDSPDLGLPEDRPLTSADVPRLRFRTGLRGYRMADVDDAIERLAQALAAAEHAAADTAGAADTADTADTALATERVEPVASDDVGQSRSQQ
jgi:DivIVA domain-containing protein